MSRRWTTAAAATGSLLLGALAACTAPSTPADPAGGDTLVLHLATADGEGVDPDVYQGPMAFVAALEDVSDGRLQVELEWDYAAGAGDAETQLVEAIVSGDVDGGWPASRAFARAGIEGLDAIEAPMLLTSEAAVDDLVVGESADAVLAQLVGTGLTGVGLMSAPLRRPVSGELPMVAPQDWAGATFRVYNSPVQAAAVRALGARPVDMTHAWLDALRVGDLDGAESDVVTDELPAYVHHITGNVVLWPKVFVTVFNQELLESLTDQQDRWIREAAELATTASVDADYDASLDLQAYCDRGTRVLEVTDAQLATLRRSVAPVLADLRHDPETEELMATIDHVAERHPDADVPLPEGGCDGAEPATDHGIPTTSAPIPQGVYRAAIPVEATAEVGNGDGWSGTWTLRIHDGAYELTCRPLDAPGVDCGQSTTDQVLEAGRLTGDDSTVWFVGDAEMLSELTGCELPVSEDDPDACFVLPPYSSSWRQEADRLVFTDAEWHHLDLVPWQRVGR